VLTERSQRNAEDTKAPHAAEAADQPAAADKPATPNRAASPLSDEAAREALTEVQKLYAALRREGRRHHEAIDLLAQRLDTDRGTVVRTLEKAEALNGRSYT
jgi:hypothetical protein